MTGAERQYKALQRRISKLRTEENKIQGSRIRLEVKAKYLLPKCPECEGSGQRYERDDRGCWTGYDCRPCRGHGRVSFPEVSK